MLQPALLATRRAVREALREEFGSAAVSPPSAGPVDSADPAAGAPVPSSEPSADHPLVLVALSGGADSLALAAAVADTAPRVGLRGGALIIDHGLQPGSSDVAAVAARAAADLGLSPVLVRRVDVSGAEDRAGGPEARARAARYAEFAAAATATGAAAILTAHTRDDQAEQVLLGIARGSGARSLAGIPARRALGDVVVLRPFLRADTEVTRTVTEAACGEAGLEFWRDPHNDDPAYARVRVRASVLPALERELGPGVAAALARTADLAREDTEAFDAMIEEQIEEIVEPAEAGIAVSVRALAANPAALRHRIIRRIAEAEFGSDLSRDHTLSIAALVTDWRGQGSIEVPGITVSRFAGRIVYTRRSGSPRDGVAARSAAMEE